MSMVPKSPRNNCYFGCDVKGPLHHFPKDDIERFNMWKKVLHNETKAKGDIYVYNQLRLCNKHFKPCYISQNNRLTKNSYPTLCLNNDDDEISISAPSQDVCMEVTDQDTEHLNDAFLLGRCVCCLKEDDLQNLWEPYIFEGVTEIYGEMLSECYTIAPQSEDNLQIIEMICGFCIKRLRDALSFRKKVLSSAQMLQNCRKKMLLHTTVEEDPLKLKIESQCENIENTNITKVDQSNENSRSVGLFQIRCFNRPKKFLTDKKINQKTFKKRLQNISCEFCGKKFDWFQNYVTHMKIIHGIEKSFKYKDYGNKNLLKHEFSKHKIQHTL